jgi:hypothetical protein
MPRKRWLLISALGAASLIAGNWAIRTTYPPPPPARAPKLNAGGPKLSNTPIRADDVIADTVEKLVVVEEHGGVVMEITSNDGTTERVGIDPKEARRLASALREVASGSRKRIIAIESK